MRRILVILSAIYCWAGPGHDALGRTIRIPADAPTIQAGIEAAQVGDTVRVGPGTYSGPGNWNLDFQGRDLVLTSDAGAAQTILDGTAGQHQYVRGMTIEGAESRSAVIEGMTFQNFLHIDEGSAIAIKGHASPTIRDCVFRRNDLGPNYPVPTIGGMSIQVRGSSTPLFVRCRVEENGIPEYISYNAAVNVDGEGVLRMEDCVITRNGGNQFSGLRVVGQGGAELVRCELSGNYPFGIYAEARVVLEDCLLFRNASPIGGAACILLGELRRCTFAANSAEPGGGGLAVMTGGDVLADRCIFSGNCSGLGSQIWTQGRLRLSCCTVADSGILRVGAGSVEWLGSHVEADPRFCDLPPCPGYPIPTGDYHLRADSPCLPQFSPCGQLIGALGQGCAAPAPIGACCIDTICYLRTQSECAQQQGYYQGDGASCYPDPCFPIAVEQTTWGRIKAKYR